MLACPNRACGDLNVATATHCESCGYGLFNGKTFKTPEFAKQQRRAQWVTNRARYDGRLTAEPCEVCGALPTHGHHEDYGKPLEVRWLCPLHHMARHREMREAAA